MIRIDIAFILLATLCLVAGVSLGIGMGIAHDFQLAPVHAHINLVGWTSLALFGLVYRAYESLRTSRLAMIHLGFAAPSAVLFPFGIYLSVAHGNPALAILASLLWFAGVLIFLGNLLRNAVFARGAVRAPLLAPGE